MKVSKLDRASARPTTDPQFFQGTVYNQQLIGADDSQEVTLLAVFFEDGARTRPHIHKTDQVLTVIEGRCVVADRTGTRELGVGESALIGAGEWHWHGAAPGNSACHISIRKPGATDWDTETQEW
jgi:quercetin dioxygenase-like cupin family protein